MRYLAFLTLCALFLASCEQEPAPVEYDIQGLAGMTTPVSAAISTLNRTDTLTNTDTVTTTAFNILSPSKVEIGGIADSISGTPSATVTLEWSPSLDSDNTVWVPLATATIGDTLVTTFNMSVSVLKGRIRTKTLSSGTQSVPLRTNANIAQDTNF